MTRQHIYRPASCTHRATQLQRRKGVTNCMIKICNAYVASSKLHTDLRKKNHFVNTITAKQHKQDVRYEQPTTHKVHVEKHNTHVHYTYTIMEGCYAIEVMLLLGCTVWHCSYIYGVNTHLVNTHQVNTYQVSTHQVNTKGQLSACVPSVYGRNIAAIVSHHLYQTLPHDV